MSSYMFNEYLIASLDTQNNLIIYDTLHYRTSKILECDIDIFNNIRTQILDNKDLIFLDENVKTLIENQIIYDRECYQNIMEEVNILYDKTIKSNKVLSLILFPTEKCNFRCVYCYEKYKLGKMSKITIENILKLIELNLLQFDQLNFSWFGGEPLLALDVIEEISDAAKEICKRYRKPFFSQITTNGYFLTVDVMKKLLEMHVMLFQITIDGNRDNHNKQRPLANGDGTYDVILNNLLEIKEKIKTQTIRIIIRVNVSVNIRADEIERLAYLFKDDKRFILNVQKVFATDVENKISPDENDFFNIYNSCNEWYDERLESDDTICYAAKENTLMIRSNGDIGKCTVNLNDPNNNFGNINDCDILKLTPSSIKFCNSKMNKEICIHCCIYPLCFGKQCPARAIQSCKTSITKYQTIIRTYSERANVIRLRRTYI